MSPPPWLFGICAGGAQIIKTGVHGRMKTGQALGVDRSLILGCPAMHASALRLASGLVPLAEPRRGEGGSTSKTGAISTLLLHV